MNRFVDAWPASDCMIIRCKNKKQATQVRHKIRENGKAKAKSPKDDDEDEDEVEEEDDDDEVRAGPSNT